jgi:uncharacterized protein YbjT (DUF2867 family)
VDYENISDHVMPDNVDVVFNCLGTTIKNAGSEEAFKRVDFDYVVELATIAKHKQAKKFISISAMGAKTSSKLFYNRIKGMAEDFLMNDSHIEDVFIVRPSLLLGNRKEFRLGETVAKWLMTALNLLFIGNLKRYKAIPAHKVAKAMLNLSKMDERGKKILENDALFILSGLTNT